MDRPKIIVFASGTKDNGGSGFENLVAASKSGILDAEIVAVVSNHEHGGVRERADRLAVPFRYFSGPYDAEGYSSVLQNTGIALGIIRPREISKWDSESVGSLAYSSVFVVGNNGDNFGIQNSRF